MEIVILTLVENTALLLAMMLVFDLLTSQKSVDDGLWRKILAGVILGFLCIGLMSASFVLEIGLIFDTRSVLLSLSGLFLGFIPTLFAMIVASIFRFWQGGTGLWPGILVIFVTGSAGILWRRYRDIRLSNISIAELYGFGVMVHILMLGVLFITLPTNSALNVLRGVGLPVLAVYPLATIALGWLMANRFKREEIASALSASEKKHRQLFETMSSGVIYQNHLGEIVSANPAAERILGVSQIELMGKTSTDPHWNMIDEDGIHIPGTDHPAMVAVRTGKSVGPVIRGIFVPSRNEYVWLSIHAIPIFHPGEDSPHEVYAIFGDITERKRLFDRLVSTLDYKEKLVQELSHRTFNNLQIIQALLAYKLSSHPEYSLKQFVNDINDQIQSMAFAYRQIQKGESLSIIELDSYLESLVLDIVSRYSSDIKVDVEFNLLPMQIFLDSAVPLATIVNELIINSIRHAFPEGESSIGNPQIEVSSSRSEAGEIVLTIEDNGIGWEPDENSNMLSKGGIGLVVSLLEGQLKGAISFDGSNGTQVVISFRDDNHVERV